MFDDLKELLELSDSEYSLNLATMSYDEVVALVDNLTIIKEFIRDRLEIAFDRLNELEEFEGEELFDDDE
jgi:hypothetical protein